MTPDDTEGLHNHLLPITYRINKQHFFGFSAKHYFSITLNIYGLNSPTEIHKLTD